MSLFLECRQFFVLSGGMLMSITGGILGVILGLLSATSIGVSVKERRLVAVRYIKALEEKGEEALAWIHTATKSAHVMFLLYSSFYSLILMTTQNRVEIILVIIGMFYELMLVVYRRRAREKSKTMKDYIRYTNFEYTFMYRLTEMIQFISTAVLCGLLFGR